MKRKYQSLFKFFGTVKDVRNLGTLVGASLLAALTPGTLDDIEVGGVTATTLDNVVNIFSESGIEGAVEAAETFWDLMWNISVLMKASMMKMIILL